MAGVEAFGVLNPNDFSDEPPQFTAANEDFHYPSIWPTKPPGAAAVEPGPRANYGSSGLIEAISGPSVNAFLIACFSYLHQAAFESHLRSKCHAPSQPSGRPLRASLSQRSIIV